MNVVEEIRAACAQVAERARHVTIEKARIQPYAASLPPGRPSPPDPAVHWLDGNPEQRAAFVLCLAAVNFGSGWFPTLRKRPGMTGYGTIASGLRDHFARQGPWRAEELVTIDRATVAETFGQDPEHELVALWVEHLRHLAARISGEFNGRWLDVVEAADGSAVALVQEMSGWPVFADVSDYDGMPVPFYKRAQLAAADLPRAGVAEFHDLFQLTMFADNLVPHVLHTDGVLAYDRDLAARIEREEQLVHGSREEVEIRACAVHAVELIVAAHGDTSAQAVDFELWNRGQGSRYKSLPRHRARCTAY